MDIDVSAIDREMLAQEYERIQLVWLDNEQKHVSFPNWAQEARSNTRAFTMCALRAIARTRTPVSINIEKEKDKT